EDAAGGRLIATPHDVDQTALSAAALADGGDPFARIEREVDVAEGDDQAVVEGPPDALEAHQGLCGTGRGGSERHRASAAIRASRSPLVRSRTALASSRRVSAVLRPSTRRS